MQKRTVKVALTLLIVASLLLVLVPPAMSRGMDAQGWKGKSEKMKNIDEVYESIVYVGSKDGVTTIDILNAAVKDKSGNVTVMNFTKPITAQYFSSNSTFVVTKPDKTGVKRQKPVKTDYNSAAINPAGASGVIALKNITMLKQDNKTAEFQFTGASVYLPDGSLKSYTFTTPVKITKSWDKHTSTIDNPQSLMPLMDALKGGAKFPANAAPVPLKTIDAK